MAVFLCKLRIGIIIVALFMIVAEELNIMARASRMALMKVWPSTMLLGEW